MPFGLLAIFGAVAYLWWERRKSASSEALTDANLIYRGWDLLTAWAQAESGSSPRVEPSSVSDPEFVSLVEEFQVWANAHGWSYQPKGGEPQPLRTDGVLDGATLSVLEAHVSLSTGTALATFTTGGHYYVSFVRGTDGALADDWIMTSQVDAGPVPTGLQGPAAWLAELAAGRAIAIGQWTGEQYGSDDRVVVFGPAKIAPAGWVETTSKAAGAVAAGCYRVSYVSMGQSADAQAAEAAKAIADVSFELESSPPSPSSGGPWPADDAGTSMGAGRSPAGMPPPPVPRVRMQWCASKQAPLPIPAGATGVRVWQQAATADSVSYRGISISLKDGGGVAASVAERWSALYVTPRPSSGAAPGPATLALQGGATRAEALHAAETAIDATLAQPAYQYHGPPME